MFVRIGLLGLLLSLFATMATAQFDGDKSVSSNLINKLKPPVYIEFARTSVCKKGSSNFNYGDLCNSKDQYGVTLNVAWLRLVNNTKWTIGLTVDKAATNKNANSIVIPSTEFIDDDGQKAWYGKMIANKGAEMDVVYKSEVETGCDFGMPKPKGKSCYMIKAIAPEISLPAIASDVFVASGESVMFPLNLAYIKKYVNIYVLYNFSWEYSGKYFSPFPRYDSQHRAYFGWYDLEKGMAKEKEAKKPIA
jgi:hypothetical protein